MARTLDLGGSERQLVEVATALDPRLFQARVACFDARGLRADDLRRSGVDVAEFPVRSFASARTAAIAVRFVSWLRRQRIALVHPFDVPTVIFGAPLARLARVRVVLSSQRGDRRLFSRGYQRALSATDRLVDGIVVNSDYLRNVLETSFGVDSARIHTCHNGLDVSAFSAADRARRPEVGADGVIIGTVAALRPEKSIETLIDAFARIGSTRHQLVIVGDGPSRQMLEARARSAGVWNRTVFGAATLDVASWYRSIDLFVLPSVNESFSNALMEAMACGCAVIASNVGGNPELVRDGENGLLFEPRNAADLARQLDRVIGDVGFRTRLADAAVRTITEGFTREAAARRFAVLYEQMLRQAH